MQRERLEPGEALARALAARGARVRREEAARLADLLLALVDRGVLRVAVGGGATLVGGATETPDARNTGVSHSIGAQQ